MPDPPQNPPATPTPAPSMLSQAYDKAKSWLNEHEQHLSEEVLKPFRQGLDNMANDLQNAAESGHTKSGGALNAPTRALAEGTGALLKMVPVGSDVQSTVQAMAVPPELGPEERAALSTEKKALDFSKLEGYELVKPAETAYRARPVGETGVAAGERPVATSSAEKAQAYKENLEDMTGKPHEVVQVPVKEGEHTKHTGPNGETWYSFKKDVPEKSVKVQEEKPSPKEVIEKQGLKYKGELSPGSGVHMFEHPSHPGKTAALNETQLTPDNVKEKMKSKLREFGVKPIKFGDSDVAKKNPNATKGLKEPENKSRIVIEGIDEPTKNPEGAYSDKIKIDPFSKDYKPRPQPVKTA